MWLQKETDEGRVFTIRDIKRLISELLRALKYLNSAKVRLTPFLKRGGMVEFPKGFPGGFTTIVKELEVEPLPFTSTYKNKNKQKQFIRPSIAISNPTTWPSASIRESSHFSVQWYSYRKKIHRFPICHYQILLKALRHYLTLHLQKNESFSK